MKYIFWQNIVSLHQSAFLSALSEKYDVTLIAERELEQYRVVDGWNVPEMGNVKIIMAPSIKEIKFILKNNADAIHIFSGIDAYPIVFQAFKMATAKGLKVLNMLEPYEWAGLKGFLRRVKYTMLRLRYGNKIDGLLAMGQIGVDSYIKAGFKPEKIFQWGYFTSPLTPLSSLQGGVGGRLPKILFVGRLDENKNSRLLIKTMEPMMKGVECLTIVGDGVLREEIDLLVQRINSNIERKRESQKSLPLGRCEGNQLIVDSKQQGEVLCETSFETKLNQQRTTVAQQSWEDIGEAHIYILGNVPNTKVHELMQQHDILVLPSNYDGWGAVVNEALQNGMRIIVSENCGSNVLADGEMRGETFYFNDEEKSLSNVLKRWIGKGALSLDERNEIKKWSEEHISGKNAAEYLKKITNYIYDDAERPNAPWLE